MRARRSQDRRARMDGPTPNTAGGCLALLAFCLVFWGTLTVVIFLSNR